MELVSFINLQTQPKQSPQLVQELGPRPKKYNWKKDRSAAVNEATERMRSAERTPKADDKMLDHPKQQKQGNEATQRMASIEQKRQAATAQSDQQINKSQLSSTLLRRKMEIQNRKLQNRSEKKQSETPMSSDQ